MIGVFRAELLKLTRPRILLGTFAAALLAAALASFVVIQSAGPSEAAGGRDVSLQDLQAAGGGTEVFSLLVSVSGFFVLVTLAANWAGEFSQGTFRTLLMKQPRRAYLLGGKMAGLLAYAAGVLLLLEALTFGLSLALAPAEGVPTSAWFSLDGVREAAGDYANALLGVSAWTSFAMLLGVVLRSTPVALGVGIAWAGPFEHIMQNTWQSVSGVFPGLLLEALAVGGTSDVSYARALGLIAGYVALAVAAAVFSFVRRDVTG